MTKTLFFGLLLGLLFVSLSFADCSVSSLSTSAASAAQVGDSLVVTVTYSTSGCTGQQLYMDTASGLTADPTSKTLGSDSGSTTFSVSAATASTYSYNARLSSTSSTSASVSFVSPDVLTILGSSTPTTVTGQARDSAFTLSIVISNPSEASITTTYSFTYDSSLITISSGATSGSVTVGAGDTTTITRSVTPTSYFTGEEVIFNLGSNTGAFTTTVSTVSQPITSSGSSSSTKKLTTTTNVTTNVTTNQTAAASNQTGAASSSNQSSSTTVQPPSTPPSTADATEKYETSVLIDGLKSKLAIMKNDGYDVSSVESGLQDAIAAYESGDYKKAKSLLVSATAASDTVKKLSTATKVTPTQPENVVVPSQPAPTPSSNLPLILVVGVLLLGVVAVAAYLLLFNKQK